MDYIILISWLITKHFIVDFLFQNDYQLKNKGNILHLGGYFHAALHGSVTYLILYGFHIPSELALMLGGGEAVAHYIIDWSKVNLGKMMNWTIEKKSFWYLLGFDQFLHNLCYLIIAVLAFSS